MQAAGRRSRRSVARPPPKRGGVGVAGLADRHGRYLAAAPAPDAENLAYGLARAAANAQQAAGRGAQAVHGQHPASNSSSSTGKPSVICRNNAFPDDPIGRAAILTWIVVASTFGSIALGWAVYSVIRKAVRGKCCDDKDDELNSLGPSIVVYPSYHGKAPQLLPSRDISFQLPPIHKLHHSSSLDAMDLLSADAMDQSPVGSACSATSATSSTKTLALAAPQAPPSPAFGMHSQRSNSFSGCPLGALDPALYRGGAADLEEEMLFPEDHLGRLYFGLLYEPTAEKLQVNLIKAKNLQSRTVATANNCDPIVKIHLIPDERRHQQSRQKKKTCNPVFDETFLFQVPSKDLEDHVLRMTVVDAGRNKRRAVIGHVSFPLSRLAEEDAARSAGTVYKMDLEKDTPEAVSDLGEMLVSLLYNENLHRLTVTVIEARRVKFRDDKAERHEAFVRVVLQQHHGQVKVKRTAVVRCADDNPNFSECFNFHVPAASIDVTSLSLQLEQPSARYGRGHKPIGKCVLGSYMFARGKALTHWNTAFGNPMQQVQQWHALST